MQVAFYAPNDGWALKFIDGKYRPCRYRLAIRAQVGQPVTDLFGKSSASL